MPIASRIPALLLAALTCTAPAGALANPPMVPKVSAAVAFGSNLPHNAAKLLEGSIPAHIERQAQLDRQYLAGSTSRKIDFFDKTFTVVRAGRTVVFDADLLGAYIPSEGRWEWSTVQRESNDPDLRDRNRVSFVTGSALTRLYGRENGIAVLSEPSFAIPTEDAAWYLSAFAAQMNKAAGVLVTIAREAPPHGTPGKDDRVIKRYWLLSRPKARGG
jgi:hypothetical protein